MGIFSWLRPKHRADEAMAALANILESGRPDMIVETTRQLISNLDPNGRVQTLVGYKNMKHIYLPVSKRLRVEQLKAGMKNGLSPDSIETYARFIAGGPTPNEAARLRCYWFLYGLFLMKAEEIAEGDPKYEEAVSEFWHQLDCEDIIENVLRENILWTAEEKDVGIRNRHSRNIPRRGSAQR
jgi:hypothetical protein